MTDSEVRMVQKQIDAARADEREKTARRCAEISGVESEGDTDLAVFMIRREFNLEVE